MKVKWLQATGFEESNVVAKGDGYFDLYTLKGNGMFTSCWKVPFIKRIKLLFTGRIWLCLEYEKQPKEFKKIFAGKDYHQPSSMTIDRPFVEAK